MIAGIVYFAIAVIVATVILVVIKIEEQAFKEYMEKEDFDKFDVAMLVCLYSTGWPFVLLIGCNKLRRMWHK